MKRMQVDWSRGWEGVIEYPERRGIKEEGKEGEEEAPAVSGPF